ELDVVPDVLWGQLYKSQRSLHREIQLNHFNILRDTVWSDEEKINVFTFEVEQRFISPVKKHMGPPLKKRTACRRFLQKYTENTDTVAGPYIEDGKWAVEISRKYNDVVELLKGALKDGGRKIGVAGKVSEKLLEGFEILVNKGIIEIYKKDIEFAKFLTDFLYGKPKWLVSHQ
nr:hypothetical protein [Candidatus Korarchaeota archaeon]